MVRLAAGRRAAGAVHVRRRAGAAQWRERLAAITHADGTARLQTLERGMAPRLYALLEAYGRRSGLPVLLNTSLNLAGEPIVNTAAEGYSTFRRCGMDVLVVGNVRMTKRVTAAEARPRMAEQAE